jgi:hypothetical protein
MHKEHKVILSLLVITVGLVLGYGLARQLKQLNPEELQKQAGVRELFYFETPADLQRLEKRNFTPRLSTEHVTQGMYSLEVNFPAGGGNLSAWRTFISNWTGSNIFSFDVYNDEYSGVTLTVEIIDESGRSKFEKSFVLSSGANHIKIKIKDIAKVIDITRIKQLVLSVREPGETTLFFDNMKLERGKKSRS